MRNIKKAAFALLGMLVLCGVTVSPAFAAAQMLVNGEPRSSAILAEGSGEITFKDVGIAGEPELLCVLKYDEEIVAESGKLTLAFIYEMLNASKENKENMVECTDMKNVCKNPVLYSALLLPWHVEYVQVGGVFVEVYLNEANKTQTFDILCETALITLEETCEGGMETRLVNAESGVLEQIGGEFGTKPLKCTLGGAEGGVMTGSLLHQSAAGLLAVS
jgi:hypothetical protein